MSINTQMQPEDINLFREQVKGIKPIKHDRVLLRKKTAISRRLKTFSSFPTEEFPFSDHIQETITIDQKLFFHRSGLQHKVLRALRQGQIPYTEILDLHGTTIEKARSNLGHFIQHCLETQQRYVLIIHGKGKLKLGTPILKNHINSWLQQHPQVLAFCSAIPKDGGSGAVYVLLRRSSI